VYHGKYDSIQECIANASSIQKPKATSKLQQLLFSEVPAGADVQAMSLDAPAAPISTEPSIEAQIANPAVGESEGEPDVVIENITVNGDMNVGGTDEESGIAPAEPKNFSDVKMFSDGKQGSDTPFSKLLFGQY
jgi:hypothetical protein